MDAQYVERLGVGAAVRLCGRWLQAKERYLLGMKVGRCNHPRMQSERAMSEQLVSYMNSMHPTCTNMHTPFLFIVAKATFHYW